MSGIFGLYYRNQQPLEVEVLNKMGTAMLHRGPDGMDMWHKNNVGIGHRLLRTTPESLTERSPYIDKNTELVITADVRLDNREQLAGQLGLHERLKQDISDGQLILAAYDKWQTKCVHYLLGDFAFMIWDQKRQQLFCARDHLGIKPFCYYLTEKIFVAASEVRAIIEVPQVPQQINEGRIADFLVDQLEGIDKVSTFYQDIVRLPPAHTLLILEDKVLLEKYWQLDPEFECHYKHDEEYVEAFREIFIEAVSTRLQCDGQAASMLSGGIDSSSIVGVAHHLMQDTGKLPVYSAISENSEDCRETQFIQKVLNHCNLQSMTVHPGELKKYEAELQAIVDRLDEPFDTHMTIIILVYLMARKNGHHVVLDGIDGDVPHSLSASYPALLLRRGHWITALSEIKGLWKNYYRDKLSLSKVFTDILCQALINNSMRRWRRQFFPKTLVDSVLHDSIINRTFASRADILGRLDKYRTHGEGLCATLRQLHIRSVTHPNLVVGLERYDRVAAACSIEARHPLLDKRLVEFSVSLPWQQKVRGGWSKFLLRRACQTYPTMLSGVRVGSMSVGHLRAHG